MTTPEESAHIEYILKREASKLDEECEELRLALAACQEKSEERKEIIIEICRIILKIRSSLPHEVVLLLDKALEDA